MTLFNTENSKLSYGSKYKPPLKSKMTMIKNHRKGTLKSNPIIKIQDEEEHNFEEEENSLLLNNAVKSLTWAKCKYFIQKCSYSSLSLNLKVTLIRTVIEKTKYFNYPDEIDEEDEYKQG